MGWLRRPQAARSGDVLVDAQHQLAGSGRQRAVPRGVAGTHRAIVAQRRHVACDRMSPSWIWMQIVIVVLVVAGMVVAAVKLL
jgi:hypothetical protein